MLANLSTKIVATVGPASRDPEMLVKLIDAGIDVVRLNFSHGDHATHAETVERIRQAAAKVGVPVAILADLQGPKLRVGNMGEGVPLENGQIVTFTTEDIEAHDGLLPVQYAGLPDVVDPEDRILLDDGLLEMRVLEVADRLIKVEVVVGGVLKSKKGINLPRASLAISAITEKDKADLKFALEHQVDWVALSFVREAQEVMDLKELIRRESAFSRPVPVIAKVEKPEAFANIDAIIAASDGIMVARGDLAIETSTEEVPVMQKIIIRKCNRAGIPVITATQMLDSMIRNPRPTRAEASDVANAILDGTDAIMLSGETAAGNYPLRTVQTMHRIAERAEAEMFAGGLKQYAVEDQRGVAAAVAHATVSTATRLNASAIITPTMSGSTARLISRYRPAMPIVATTPSPLVQRQLSLYWGVYPLLARRTESTDQMIDASVQAALDNELIHEGDTVVITGGTAGSPAGSSDLMKVQMIKKLLGQGDGIGTQVVTGRVRILEAPVDPMLALDADEIIVTAKTDRSFVNVAQRAAGLVTEESGMNSHSSMLAVELGIPAIVGISGATSRLQDGQMITLDTRQGHVYAGAAH
ncbi:MAG: pyruvate kinase [Anaerolineales bacterium]|nr:pyruvate kinase [Anaerolineales bacterium]MCB9127373.1 pyruvate kinase [Ardenticatenales bacterium]MCB9172707.1 pyruvate kinase [Ardenticatenales bacterium]